MNNLYLVLPIIDNNSPDEESCCLKTLNSSEAAEYFEDLIKNLHKAFKWVGRFETFKLFHDHAFIELQKKNEAKGQRPEILPLMTELPQLEDMPKATHGVKIYNNVQLQKGIVCSYVNNANKSFDAMIDHNGLLCDVQQLNIKDALKQDVKCVVVQCDCDELFKWFVDHRDPARQFHPNPKHNGKQKTQKGSPVSTCHYKATACRNMLKWAIGIDSHSRKYFLDYDNRRLVIFMDENLPSPTFHCFDVDINDEDENAKMKKDCGKDILEQLNDIFNLWENNQ